MSNNLALIFTIDDRYIQHFTAALTSLLENNTEVDFDVFVINDLDDLTEINKIVLFFENKYEVSINLLTLDNKVFDHYTLTHHVSKATYFRLMIAAIMPVNINKALFLDSDIIISGSIKELVNKDFGENFLLAVPDLDFDSIKRLNDLGVPAKGYFNAGVLLINLKRWREENVTDKLIATAKQYMNDLLWWDQDVLNIYFFDKWSELPSTFNQKNVVKRLKQLPAIIHYAGYSKPWHYLNSHPYKKLYWKYLKLTPYKNAGYKDFTFKNIIKRIVFFNRQL